MSQEYSFYYFYFKMQLGSHLIFKTCFGILVAYGIFLYFPVPPTLFIILTFMMDLFISHKTSLLAQTKISVKSDVGKYFFKVCKSQPSHFYSGLYFTIWLHIMGIGFCKHTISSVISQLWAYCYFCCTNLICVLTLYFCIT